MQYRIFAEGHSGVFSVDEEYLGLVEATNAFQALKNYADSNNNVRWVEGWKCFIIGECRKVFAQEVK